MEQRDTLLQGGTHHAPHDTISDGPARYCGPWSGSSALRSGTARTLGWRWPRLGERWPRRLGWPPPWWWWRHSWRPYWRAGRWCTGRGRHERWPTRLWIRVWLRPTAAASPPAATACLHGAGCPHGTATGLLLCSARRVLLRLVNPACQVPALYRPGTCSGQISLACHSVCWPAPAPPPHGR